MSKFEKGKGPIFGVCGGIADYIGMNAIIVRILFVATSLFFFLPLVAYIILAIAMPKGNQLDSGEGSTLIQSNENSVFCRSCGSKNPKAGKFCRSCGEPLKS